MLTRSSRLHSPFTSRSRRASPPQNLLNPPAPGLQERIALSFSFFSSLCRASCFSLSDLLLLLLLTYTCSASTTRLFLFLCSAQNLFLLMVRALAHPPHAPSFFTLRRHHNTPFCFVSSRLLLSLRKVQPFRVVLALSLGHQVSFTHLRSVATSLLTLSSSSSPSSGSSTPRRSPSDRYPSPCNQGF